MIRLATAADLPLLPAIEIAAGALFRALGMIAIADDAPPTVAELESFLRSERLWVATAPPPTPNERMRSFDQIERTADSLGSPTVDRPVGYAAATVLDGHGHLEQVSVDPRWARRRLGAALIGEVVRWAAARDDRRLTLTTFRDVPWNAPYYARLGFGPVPSAEIGPELRAVRAREHAHGLDAWPRTTMQVHLPAARGT